MKTAKQINDAQTGQIDNNAIAFAGEITRVMYQEDTNKRLDKPDSEGWWWALKDEVVGITYIRFEGTHVLLGFIVFNGGGLLLLPWIGDYKWCKAIMPEVPNDRA